MTCKRGMTTAIGACALAMTMGGAQSAPLGSPASDFKSGAAGNSGVERVAYRLCWTEGGARQCRWSTMPVSMAPGLLRCRATRLLAHTAPRRRACWVTWLLAHTVTERPAYTATEPPACTLTPRLPYTATVLLPCTVTQHLARTPTKRRPSTAQARRLSVSIDGRWTTPIPTSTPLAHVPGGPS